MAHPARRETLIATLASARGELTGYGQALRRDLDVSARVRHAVRAQPAGWFGGAALLGLLLSKLPPLQRKVEVKPALFRRSPAKEAGKAAFALTLVKFALDLARPALTAWVKSKMIPSFSSPGAPRERAR
jgi:hypothetical protein